MIDINTRLSENFILGEFLRSATAERHKDIIKEQLNPPDSVVTNLSYLCANTLQPIREKLGAPMRITSGYRCKSLNNLVGSTDSSQHLYGQAVDIQLTSHFIHKPKFAKARNKIKKRVREITGHVLRDDINANFFLFCYICIRIENLDIDQVIHEYGESLGRPGWIHVSSSPTSRDKREIVTFGHYLTEKKEKPDIITALNYGTRN